MSVKLGVIGGGVMGSAIVSRLLTQGTYQSTDIIISEPTLSQQASLHQQYGVEVTGDNNLAAMAPVLLLAIKPQIFERVVADLKQPNPSQLVISILAGVSIAQLERAFPDRAVIRAMPNTPALIGQGMTGVFARPATSGEDRALVVQLLAPTGELLWVDTEINLDAVTAMSGSGPAYVFYFIEAMTEAGVEMGLPADQAQRLAIGTFTGASALAKGATEAPSVLRQRVTSKGGTTYAAITSLETADVKAQFKTAIRAAQKRAAELGEEFGNS